MGEKGNGGHVATGGARAVRQATGASDVGMGGSHLGGGAAAAAGSGFMSDLASEAGDHATDAGGAVVERVHEEHNED